jgi:hypothetical protein
MDIPGWPPENIEEMAKKREQELLRQTSSAAQQEGRPGRVAFSFSHFSFQALSGGPCG